jgi:hypothetical protein
MIHRGRPVKIPKSGCRFNPGGAGRGLFGIKTIEK